jgi:DNA-binding transcriptional ArsR family regulator
MVVGKLDEREAADDVVDRVFQALADPTRRDIVATAMSGEHSVSALARRYPMSFAAVQKHVAILERAGLVTKVRRGRETLVRTHFDELRRATDVLDAFEALWRGRLERFADVLTDVAPETPATPATTTSPTTSTSTPTRTNRGARR